MFLDIVHPHFTMKLLKLAAFVLVSACASSGEEQTTKTRNTPNDPLTEIQEEEEVAVAMNPQMEQGKSVYNQYCLACHQADGKGVPGAFPTLVQTKWTAGDAELLVPVIINGMQGPIEVKGESYNSVMPQHGFLSDEDIAAVLTYLRQSFGNDASEITTDEVAKIRSEVASE